MPQLYFLMSFEDASDGSLKWHSMIFSENIILVKMADSHYFRIRLYQFKCIPSTAGIIYTGRLTGRR